MDKMKIASELIRLARSLMAEEELPEDAEKYFKIQPGTMMLSLHDIETIRARPKGIENAEKYMGMAYRGEGERRKPISVVRVEGGKWKVFDGNSTTAIARKHGWKKIPALEVDEQGNYVKKGSPSSR